MNSYLSDKSLKAIVIISLAYVTPIVLTGGLYIDDIGRSLTGLAWMHDGRVLTSALMILLSGGYPVTDIYPIGNIASSLLIALSGFTIAKSFGINTRSLVPLSLLILFSPFMLENLSYRFDSLSMGISILAICIPFLWYNKCLLFIVTSVICVYVSLQTYQASSTCYLVIACFFCADEFRKSFKNGMLLGIASCFSFLTSTLLSSITWKALSLDMNGRGGIINSQVELTDNIYKYIDLLSDATSYQLVFSLALLLLPCVLFLMYVVRSGRKFHMKALPIIMVALALIISIGPGLFLSGTWWTPRIMIGAPVFLTCLCCLALAVNGDNWLTTVGSWLYLFAGLILCVSYANATKANNEYIDSIISMARPYISSTDESNLVINGEVKRPARVKIYDDKFPIIKHLIPTYMSNSWTWGVAQFKRTDSIGERAWGLRGERRVNAIKNICSMRVALANKDFTLYSDSNISILDFNKVKCAN